MKKENSKQRLFALVQLLMKHSDPAHPLSMPAIISALEAQGIPCERKAIYDDFKVLSSAGLEVEFVRTPQMGYYLSGRIFDAVDLKILIDAVCASSFLTQKKSAQLISKLLLFSTVYEQDVLSMDSSLPKSTNEQVLYTIDTLIQAISEKKKIQFTYFDLGMDKKRHYRRQKRIYEGDPYALIWENKAYYLLFKLNHHDQISQYRVDKMDNVLCTETVYESIPFDLKSYRAQRINMYSGEKVNVTLQFENNDRLASIIYDQFGDDFILVDQNDSCFIININTSISPTLMGWLTTLHTQVKILKPESLKQEYQDYLKRILSQYSEVKHESDQ